jgi:arylsulfatase A-like enzyme
MLRSSMVLALLALPFLGGCESDPVRDPAPVDGVPYIILVTLDTVRATHTTPYGSARDTTPHLAAFARQSVQFQRAYAVMPTTGPSHVSMLTGLYPQEHGVMQNGMPAREGLEGLPLLMRKSGRRTGAFVSALHLAPDTVNLDGFEVWDSPSHVRDGAETIEAAMRWAERHRREPFFLWLHLFDPHDPYMAHAGLSDEIAKALAPLAEVKARESTSFLDAPMSEAEARKLELLYDADIYYTDQLVGRFLGFLEEIGIASQAAIVITADHGEILGEAIDRWRYGFDHGELLLPGEVHVPLWVRMPGGPAGTTEDALVEIRAVCGSLLWAAKIAGAESLPRLPGFGGGPAGDGAERMAFVMRRTFQGKNLPEILQGSRIGVVRGDTMAVRIQRDGRTVTLFDLQGTGNALHEVTDASPEVVQSHERALDQWLASLATGDGDGEAPAVSEEMREHLRALGYVE